MASVSVRTDRAGMAAALLAEPRYEVIPFKGIEEKVGVLSPGTHVTVTASPAHGLERTVDVAETLAARGLVVIPHLAARMVTGRAELERHVRRLSAAGIDEAFVIGGDATPPAGPYSEAGDLLDELAGLEHPFTRIGVGAYPEGHPLVADELLLEALTRKQQYATHMVTQLCFDADALTDWVRFIRSEGIDLPLVVGLPGVVERRKLAEISLRSGVGASLRYLRKNGRQLASLARARRYDPTKLTMAVAGRLENAGLPAAGAHLFTFNQVEATHNWVRSLAGD